MARLMFANTTDGWEQMVTSMAANPDHFARFEQERSQLQALLEQARHLAAQQAALTASKQTITRQLQGVLINGQKIATFMKAGVKHQYGARSEKLVEFGMQPFRGQSRAKAAPSPAPASASEPV